MEKVHADKLRHYIINTVIPDLEENGLPVINGIVSGVAGSLMGTTTVGNYAEVLKKNLTSTSVDFSQDSYNSVRARKRQHIIPTYGRENNSLPDDDIPRVINGPKQTKNKATDVPNDWNT